MKLKLPLFLFAIAIIFSCSSVKKTQEAINFGNYDEAINIALKNLRTNKTKKSNQPYIKMLETAFKKVTERDLNKIDFLKKDGNPANLEGVYNMFVNLENRQQQIIPLLPLYNISTGKEAQFRIRNYNNDILNAKNDLANYLYTKAKSVLENSKNKFDFRNAFEDLNYLNDLNPEYMDVAKLMDEAHFKGTDFVYVTMLNKSRKVIPMRLEKDLLDFDTYKLNNFWTVYHNNRQGNINYNYQLEILLRELNISPESIKEKESLLEKKVKDGWEYKKNSDGEILKDSIGKKIKIDIYKRVKCKINEVYQTKSTQVIGQVKYYNLNTNQLLKSFPLTSEFVFENIYATYIGDKRALSKQQKAYVGNTFIKFPTNEQMIYDSGENLKSKIKTIISKYKFQ
ncbi:hypothetical protein [uncultured Lutibacter sp.]|uniref:hypothetical protein n=1 Tax=uncultured Lutibacter sp. TaxID=437739 RepID=UPI0026305615|nr:hypothetical protein [uncultured Lutibacter sp.]